MTTKEIIEAHRDEYLAAKTHLELKALFARDGLATQQRWHRAVEAVKAIGGIDYYVARDGARRESAQELAAAVTHRISLYVDAKAANWGHYAICDATGQLLEHGKLFEDYFSYGDASEQSACECAAARRAIRVARIIGDRAGAAAIELTLHVDAQWLTSLAGKASILASDARRARIALVMDWVPGADNPADRYTTQRGYSRAIDRPDLSSLAVSVSDSRAGTAVATASEVATAD